MTRTPHPGVFWQEIMQQRGLTQVLVAERIGCSDEHLSRIVHGRKKPSAELTRRFAQLCTVSGRDLWRRHADYLYDLMEETAGE